MNFEKIELYGFKSFADKAEIKFGNGITGIVGPNGCGKSNVADAIRWVLGEQSAKSLRGSNMQDVIFAGTQSRKSLSYCEVSLFFDNTQRIFDLDYNEVIITRKLYRSGESEYLINKQPARRKDIVNHLRECGLGKEGYVVIGQGRVEEIMSAKPEDRRLIFEEATGISKFKDVKKDSESKLARAHDNLQRYSDIIAEIENQLGPLERQALKAKEFNEISEELKHHEINTYIAKVDGVETAKGKINVKIKAIDEETALRLKEQAFLVAEYEKIFTDITSADDTLRKLNEELLEKSVGMESVSGAQKLFAERISQLRGQIERAEQAIEDNKSTVLECSKAYELNEEERVKAVSQLDSLLKKLDGLTKKILSLTEKISLGEELADKNRRKFIESVENLTDVRVSTGTKSIQRDNLTAKLEELNARRDELSVKRDGLFNDKEKCDKLIDELDRSIFDCRNNISAKEDEVRSGNELSAKIGNREYNLNSEISTLMTRDNFYRAQKISYEGFTTAVKNLMGRAKDNPELKKRIKGVVAELIKNDKKFDVALETALAAAAQNVVTSTPEDAKYLIEYLKKNNLGRLTFLPITSVKPRIKTTEVSMALKETGALGVADELVSFAPEFKNVISNLLGNTLIVDNIDNATKIANKYRFAFKMVTLEGDVFTSQGSMTGGSRRVDVAGLLSNDRRLEENATQLKIKRAEMDKLKAERAECESVRDRALDELNLLNDMYSEKRQQLVVEREKQQNYERALSEVGREIETVGDLISDVQEQLDKVSADFEAIRTGSKKLEQDKEMASQSASQHQAEYDVLKKERDELTNQSTETQVAITELKARISSLSADNERLLNAKKEAEDSIVALEKNNKSSLEMIETLKREEEKIVLSKEEQDYINSIRDKIGGIEDSKAQLREKLNKNDEQKAQVADSLSVLSDKKHAQEIALAKIDSDLEYLQQSVWEDYQVTYETALKYKEEGYDGDKGEAEINRLRRKRASLGAINATAIEESKALRERYEDMIKQRDDVEKAKADLLEGLEKIKAEMLAQFNQGFAEINNNFQRIFKELFGGGSAMLEIDYSEADDKLEAGIEIIAQPPGKKLQKISLLSGGEKALTAIAILFAILRLRPMPFCVLDEVEAALDEANVDRFAQYLKKFSDGTQFIVITHKKPTMEHSDALFGVTMQEKGVSKLVSVKLSDVAEITGDSSLA